VRGIGIANYVLNLKMIESWELPNLKLYKFPTGTRLKTGL
jgi:hypothetical protein